MEGWCRYDCRIELLPREGRQDGASHLFRVPGLSSRGIPKVTSAIFLCSGPLSPLSLSSFSPSPLLVFRTWASPFVWERRWTLATSTCLIYNLIHHRL